MEELMLFTDGSVNTHSKIGYGAYLVVPGGCHSSNSLKAKIKVRKFEATSSTKLELQTLLWALSDIKLLGNTLMVYSDSQNIISLPGRRERLEQNDYRSKNNKLLKNYELYQEFYRVTDQINCEFVKVRGHQAANQKNNIDRLFMLVDRASRNALRSDILDKKRESWET